MFGWFDLAWPWIGLAFAIALVVLLLATDLLRSDRSVVRWRDLRWLSFLAVAVYLVHNVEEYGIAADGALHAFPDSLCALLGQPAYPRCAIPPAFYLFVNLPLVWIAGPLAALLLATRRWAGLTLWGVIAVNAVVHIVPALVMRAYDPGLLTAVLLFLPLSVVAGRALFGPGGSCRPIAGVPLLGAGILMHAVLAGSVLLFLRGGMAEWILLALQPLAVLAGYVLVWSAVRPVRSRKVRE